MIVALPMLYSAACTLPTYRHLLTDTYLPTPTYRHTPSHRLHGQTNALTCRRGSLT